MLSMENIGELQQKNLSYIVGARIANLSPKLQTQVSDALGRREGTTVRLPTRHGDLLCSFSQKRFEKDMRDMEKQVARAKKLVASGEQGRRAKFVSAKGAAYVLNESLITKTEKLLGIKGYVTNIPREVMSDQQIIDYYRNLWHVEQAFRVAKSDLKARPMFHRIEDSIRAHLLICFLALTMSKYMELKTGLSLQRIITLLRSTGEAIVRDTASGQEYTIPSVMLPDAERMLQQLGVSY
jgi:hypothetical protein